jgi:hypothetical protein
MKKSYNPLLNDPEIKAFLDANPIPASIHDQLGLLGSNDQRIKPYRPDLRNLTGSFIGTVLYSQLLYYLANKAMKEKKSIYDVEIYKFKEPCDHSKYKELDSWCEELNISREEFDIALKKIGVKITKKEPNPKRLQTALVTYRTDINRITWYRLNKNYINNLLKTITTKQTNDSRKVAFTLYENSQSHDSIYREDITEKTDFFSSSEEKNLIINKNIYEVNHFGKKDLQGSRGSDSLRSGGTQAPGAPNVSMNLAGVQEVLDVQESCKEIDKGLNGTRTKSSCKKVKVKIRKKKPLVNKNDDSAPLEPNKETLPNSLNLSNLPKLKKLPKIQIKPNPLKSFNFPSEVFEVLNHWKNLGGKIPKDPNRRKIADQISNQIQELLIHGNNPYTPVLDDSDLDQFRNKKWTVQEIKDCITYFVKVLHKEVEKIPFNQFILERNYKTKKNKPDYSYLVNTFKKLPQELSYLAKKIKNDFTTYFPDVHIYDKSFINIANFLEQKLKEYKSYQPYATTYFEPRFVNNIFLTYMSQKVAPKGTYDELKYMANPQNLTEFIDWCKSLNLITPILAKEKQKYFKELRQGYKNQLKSYQMDIDNGKSYKWNEESWEYFEFLKEQELVDAN